MAYIGDEVWRLWARPTAAEIVEHEGHSDVTDEILASTRYMIALGAPEARFSLHREGVTQWTIVSRLEGAEGETEYVHIAGDGTFL